MCKALLPLKLLADADKWQILGRNLYFVFSAFPFKKRSRGTGQKREEL